MTNIRRYFDHGNVYFLTHVTHKRAPILLDHVDLLWLAFDRPSKTSSYEMPAWVILPDHIHMLISSDKEDLSLLVRRFKLSFSGYYRKRVGSGSGRVWQNRYWDHVIRDTADMNRHIDYIHYNPIKHGLATNPFDWTQSSIHKYFERGYYSRDWGSLFKVDEVGE
ncbi:MAG: transposase [Candidatus Zixiibacteriota bacterium]